MKARLVTVLGLFAAAACGRGVREGPAPAARPSILLVTLDTTRADAIGPDAKGIETPAFNGLAARGRLFHQAYATVPETLPSHASLMTGLYPAGHGVHENGRVVSAQHLVLAERLRTAGYGTAAFVSSFVLSRRFGLARGFDSYDDTMAPGQSERSAVATTDRALAHLGQAPPAPLFLWVHYFDPHAPYDPPEPFRTRHARKPYLGEVAAMDEQLGRLVGAFLRKAAGSHAVLVVGDHGEGLGEHGESQHGHLLYQGTMHAPLVIAGPGVSPGVVDSPVSTRRVFHTILDWAGLGTTDSLRDTKDEVVLGEAMKPFLSYGWQPQVMAVEGPRKTIQAGRLESYAVVGDPGEARDLGDRDLSRTVRTALREYPAPTPGRSARPDGMGDDERRRLASLGYVAAGSAPLVRKDAPRPADMAHLLDLLERASGMFVREEYAQVIPLLERIRREDPGNLDAVLRLATAHSSLRHDAQAMAAFERARQIAPESEDVRTYLALHYERGREWERAAPLLERIVADSPDRLPALEALGRVRERQGRPAEALAIWQRIQVLRPLTPAENVRRGLVAMAAQHTPEAIDALEKARAEQGSAFGNDLELGVLYLSARRFPEARDALDRVKADHPEYPMALFKRAQVSVLLREQDVAARIDAARKGADATTRDLIARERLFRSQP